MIRERVTGWVRGLRFQGKGNLARYTTQYHFLGIFLKNGFEFALNKACITNNLEAADA